MDVTGPETDWRSTNFRQKLVSQIDDAMRKAGVAHNKSSKDMESHVFMKAKTRVRHFVCFQKFWGIKRSSEQPMEIANLMHLVHGLCLEHTVMQNF
uniref:Mediator of RNA polymerase II transcription subunit 15 n=1 Tax=Athene cunicularia TaxID=194338 RepID=A0A663MC99_ATHCN